MHGMLVERAEPPTSLMATSISGPLCFPEAAQCHQADSDRWSSDVLLKGLRQEAGRGRSHHGADSSCGVYLAWQQARVTALGGGRSWCWNAHP